MITLLLKDVQCSITLLLSIEQALKSSSLAGSSQHPPITTAHVPLHHPQLSKTWTLGLKWHGLLILSQQLVITLAEQTGKDKPLLARHSYTCLYVKYPSSQASAELPKCRRSFGEEGEEQEIPLPQSALLLQGLFKLLSQTFSSLLSHTGL